MNTYQIHDRADQQRILAPYQVLAAVRTQPNSYTTIDTVVVRGPAGVDTLRFVLTPVALRTARTARAARAGQVISPTPISSTDAVVLVVALGGVLLLAWSQGS